MLLPALYGGELSKANVSQQQQEEEMLHLCLTGFYLRKPVKRRGRQYVNFQFSRGGKKPAPASSKESHTYNQLSHIERNEKKVYKSTIFLTVFHALKLNHEHSCSRCTRFSFKKNSTVFIPSSILECIRGQRCA